jgi:regulator of protease activity HflC (stomatin/prohibitin superfamily)
LLLVITFATIVVYFFASMDILAAIFGSLIPLGAIVIGFFVVFIRQVNQYERGVMLTLGRYSGIKQPGWRLVIPVLQQMQKIDVRVKAVDVPSQEAITKDNISCEINAVIYYKVSDAAKAFLEVQHYTYAISQLAQTTMRNVVGKTDLDELLSNREAISQEIKNEVDVATDPWGIQVISVELKDIALNNEMKRVMGKQAEAEREKRAVIIKAEGEVMAAENMTKAAKMLAEAPGALHLRTLQSINDLSSDQSNTTIWMVPVEAIKALEGIGNMVKK